MPRLIWAPAALRDIADLHNSLKVKDRGAACRAVAVIRQGMKVLGEYPEIGRPVEGMQPEFRTWPISLNVLGYVVRCRDGGDEVLVVGFSYGREERLRP